MDFPYMEMVFIQKAKWMEYIAPFFFIPNNLSFRALCGCWPVCMLHSRAYIHLSKWYMCVARGMHGLMYPRKYVIPSGRWYCYAILMALLPHCTPFKNISYIQRNSIYLFPYLVLNRVLWPPTRTESHTHRERNKH